jgi:RNA-directed DNA polymerase
MRAALAERLAKFGLELHPDKTRVIRFGRFAQRDCGRDGKDKLATFDFLGFTHIAGKSRAGRYRLHRRSSRKKRSVKLARLSEEIRRRSHQAVSSQYKWLSAVLRGHYAYYGVPGNYHALETFRHQVENQWHRRLQRRSQRARWTKEQRSAFRKRWTLPPPRITHPWPSQRRTGR